MSEFKRPRPYGPPYVPHEEHERVVVSLRKELTEGPGRHRKSLTKRWLINQERLNALAEHHDTKVEYNDRPPVVKQVTVEYRLKGRTARAHITALGPIQGRAEPYTQETLPEQVGGAEKTSEGVRGVDEIASAHDKETIKP